MTIDMERSVDGLTHLEMLYTHMGAAYAAGQLPSSQREVLGPNGIAAYPEAVARRLMRAWEKGLDGTSATPKRAGYKRANGQTVHIG